jgi:hypothetical protein
MNPAPVDVALSRQHPCFGDCYRTLTLDQRRRAVEVIYHCDDALRGWAYRPLYDIDGDRLWREAQRRDDPSYRGVAVRFGECIYRRLVGSMLHEVLHAALGDTTKANYGIPFGLPYGVPHDVADRDVEAYLEPFNFCEARAFVGVGILAERVFGIDWPVLNAREYATLGFAGGNALVSQNAGYRSVPHVDPVHHRERYLRLARSMETRALAWFEEAGHLSNVRDRIDAAAARGRQSRPSKYASASRIASVQPAPWSRNDPCPCLSGRKVKKCCGGGSALRGG